MTTDAIQKFTLPEPGTYHYIARHGVCWAAMKATDDPGPADVAILALHPNGEHEPINVTMNELHAIDDCPWGN